MMCVPSNKIDTKAAMEEGLLFATTSLSPKIIGPRITDKISIEKNCTDYPGCHMSSSNQKPLIFRNGLIVVLTHY